MRGSPQKSGDKANPKQKQGDANCEKVDTTFHWILMGLI